MIEIIALIALIIFALYLVITFVSYIPFFLNLIIIIAFYFLISKDLKNKDNHKYYLFSLLLTAIFFILSYSGFTKNFLIFTEKIQLSPVIVAVIITYVFAHLISFIFELYRYLKEKYKDEKKVG